MSPEAPSDFNTLYAAHHIQLRRQATRVLRDHPNDVDDALQNAWVKIHRGLPRFRKDAKFTTWATTIVVNEALYMIRRKSSEVRRAVKAEAQGLFTTAKEPYDEDVEHIVQAALEELRPQDAQVLRMRYLGDGMRIKDIAAREGETVSAIKSRAMRALGHAKVAARRMEAED